MFYLYLGGVLIFVTLLSIRRERLKGADRNSRELREFPLTWRLMLQEKVAFYGGLDTEEKKTFEQDMIFFLDNCRITGVKTSVEDIDRVLIAASAVIPVFRFPGWEYGHLCEVLLYPSSFDEKFNLEGSDRSILGMVGTGYMEGKMILSKQALHHGFEAGTDKQNTAIHEFIHLVDKADGAIDGVPEVLLNRQYALPWLELMRQKIEAIGTGDFQMNPYGATSQVEFFAVVGEYFFEHPKQLKSKEPELYAMLEKIFRTDMAEIKLQKSNHRIGRNDPCVCGSGKKFKKCCGAEHYR